jgi:hypothetical protein
VLSAAFPRKDKVSRDALYLSIGHPEYISDARMVNTCGVRMSVALVAAGVPIQPGNLTAQGGKYSGRQLESGQARLSKVLLRLWGAPEKYAGGPAARKGIGKRRGVVSFFQLNGPTDRQGHIDLVAPDNWDDPVCADDCYWQSVEVWFWPLK